MTVSAKKNFADSPSIIICKSLKIYHIAGNILSNVMVTVAVCPKSHVYKIEIMTDLKLAEWYGIIIHVCTVK